jgi:DNA-binding transcriptional MerR regulator
MERHPLDDGRRTPLRTIEVASASGYSVQQVRDLERLGVIPPAARSSAGYRRYAPIHVHALRAYRGLARAVGPVEARRLLAELRAVSPADAAAAISAVHARLARERDDLLRARAALESIRAEPVEPAPRPGIDGREPDAAADAGGAAMTITELAEALQVRTSTLRFWEDEGLVRPERITSLRVRRYDTTAIGEARIVAALRGAGYRVPAVREIIETLRRYEASDEVGGILQRRLDELATRAVALLRAGADLAEIVEASGRSSG